MYGENIGKIITVADNIVEELNDQNNICIVLDTIPEANIYIRDAIVKLPMIYTPDSSIRELNLSIPLEESLNDADKCAIGELRPTLISTYNVPFLQIGSSKEMDIQFVLSQNWTIENNYAISKYKDRHPLAYDDKYLNHPVMGWKISGNNKDELTDRILKISLKQPKGIYKPTLNHLAWIKEATTEIKYHAGNIFK